MSNLKMEGTLAIETASSSLGDAVRVAFYPGGEAHVGFACWIKEENLSGNVKEAIAGVTPKGLETTMIGYSELTEAIARVVLSQRKEPLNTFGIGED